MKKSEIIPNTIITGLALLIILCGAYLYQIMEENKALEVQQDLAQEVVRFHVLAASDSEIDQALKLLVKNRVLEYMSEPLSKAESASEALNLLEDNKEKIIELAKEVIEENGYDYPVSAQVEDIYFPVKTYGDVTFPAGVYTAFRIIIGEGSGSNWWCVLYPPLCFVDVTHGIVPEESKQQLKHVLTDDEYAAITSGEIDTIPVIYRFRLLSFLNPSD